MGGLAFVAWAQAHPDFLSRRGQNLDFDACRQRLLDHVDGEWSPELLQRPRQVIIAADFPKQVTHSVVWLSEMSLDIDLIQEGLWKVEGHVIAGFTKVYPTPEVEDFTLAPARVKGEAAAKKLQERARSRNAVHVLVGAGLLPEGTKLLVTPRHGTTEATRNAISAWVEEDSRRETPVWDQQHCPATDLGRRRRVILPHRTGQPHRHERAEPHRRRHTGHNMVGRRHQSGSQRCRQRRMGHPGRTQPLRAGQATPRHRQRLD